MAEAGYKSLISYKLANIAFLLGWEFVPIYYNKYEDNRQRDQIKQALRSDKQNIVEGDSERSLSSKLKLLDVAKASSMEALEDFEDILKFEGLPCWNKDDPRLKKLRQLFEGYPISNPSPPPPPSITLLKEELGGVKGKEGLEAIVNYIIDVLIRGGFMLDKQSLRDKSLKQINALEKKHQAEGGYNENLLEKRLEYRRKNSWQKGFLKLTKRTLVTYLIGFFIFSGSGLLYLFGPWTKSAQAAWFNDNWAYRKAINVTVTSTSSDQTYVDTLLTIDTNLGSTKLQPLCQDLRFTSTSGKILPYYIPDTSSCNTNATNKIWVRADLVPKNTTTYTMYMYYGNPAASAGSDATTMFQENGLVGYWKMNESSWTNDCSTGSVLDSSVNSGNGVSCPNGTGVTTLSTGNYGNAPDFNGSSQYVQVNSPTLPTGDFTYSAWVNLDTNGDETLFMAADGSGGNELIINVGTVSTGRVTVAVNDEVFTGTATTTTVSTGTWTHVVVTRANGLITTYVNGVADATTHTNSTTLNFNGCALLIGVDADTTCTAGLGNYLDGKVDNARVYNRALSASEISQLYTNPGGTVYLDNASTKFTASLASEENAPSPTLYWKFDDPAVSSVIQDATANGLDGTLNNTPTFQTEDQCISGKCYYFSGTANMNVSIADNAKLDFVAADNFTVQAWVKRNGASSAINYIITKAQSGYTGYKLYQDASGDYCFDVKDGTNTDTACTSAVEFDDDQWHLVTGVKAATTSITLYVDGKQRAQDASISATGTLANTGTFYAGVDLDGTSNEWLGFIDEVKVFRDQTARTAAQIAADFNARSNPEGVAVAQGANTQNQPAALSNGLVGYWKMDEASGNAADSSGNAVTLTNNSSTSYSAGKFGNAGSFVAASTDYFSTATTISGVQTVAFWVNPSSTSDEFVNLTSGAYITSSSGTVSATGFTSPTIYVNGVLNGTITASVWNHVVVTTGSSISANQVEVGRANAAYTNGSIDEIRVYQRALSSADISVLYNFAPGPVGYWKMDEGTWTVDCSTTSALDSSGNGYNASSCPNSTGPTGGAIGKYGKSGNFDGSDDYLKISTTIPSPTNALTFSAWIKRNSLTQKGDIVAKYVPPSNDDFEFIIDDTGQDNKLCLYIQNVGTDPYACSTGTISDTNWHHVVTTRSGGTIQFYIDGVSSGTTTGLNTADLVNTSEATTVGAIGDGTFLFSGQIDDLKIYNYVRTSAQVVEDMNAGHPAPGSPVGTPVGYWKFNEGADNTCTGGTNDACNSGSAGSALDGAQSGLAVPATSSSGWTDAGKFNKGIIFDGSNDGVSVPDAASTSPASAITISQWVYPTAAGNVANTTASLWKGNIDSGTDQSYGLIFGSDRKMNFRIGNSSTFDTLGGVVLSLNTWSYVAATYDGTTMKIYTNGLLVGSKTSTIGSLKDTSQALYIGTSFNTAIDVPFTGTVDEVKLYDTVLTDSQIALDYNRASGQVQGALSDKSTYAVNAANQEYCVPGDTTSCAAPVGRWDFEEGTGTTVYDTTSSNSNLTWAGTGTHYGLGKFGKAGQYNGTDDGTTSFTDHDYTSSNFTFEAWIKRSALAGTFQTIIGQNTGGTPFFQISDTNNIRVGVNNVAEIGQSTTSISDTTSWHHIVWTKASTVNKVYLDGKNVSGTMTNQSITSTGGIYIGLDNGGTFQGSMDSIKIYNYARTAAQIAWDYNRGGPVGFWKMDECQGTTLNDSAGNSLTGTYTGTTTIGTCSTASTAWGNGVAGKRNYSLDFAGADEVVTVTNASTIDIDNNLANFTFSAWFNAGTAGESNVGQIYNKTANNYLRVDNPSGSNLDIEANLDRATTDANINVSTATTTGTWTHVAETWDGTTLTLYINGVSRGTATGSGAVTADTGNLLIGGATAANFDGQIDDFRIYNYALTATQVKTVMDDGAYRVGPATGAP